MHCIVNTCNLCFTFINCNTISTIEYLWHMINEYYCTISYIDHLTNIPCGIWCCYWKMPSAEIQIFFQVFLKQISFCCVYWLLLLCSNPDFEGKGDLEPVWVLYIPCTFNNFKICIFFWLSIAALI